MFPPHILVFLLFSSQQRLALFKYDPVTSTKLLDICESSLKPVDGVGLTNLIGALD
jgi:hypothetical protein